MRGNSVSDSLSDASGVGCAVELAGFGVDQYSHCIAERVSLDDCMPSIGQSFGDVFGNGERLDLNFVRQPLVVEPWHIDSFPHVHPVVDDIYKDLEDGCYDPAAAGGADRHEEFAFFEHESR